MSGFVGNSGTTTTEYHLGGGGGGEEQLEEERGRSEEGDQNLSGGGHHRWPRHETMALLKIRSDMDVVFRESSLKGQLWEEVSRKLAGFGYHRSAKKCKEKFENIYKYHKRTKEGRSMKKDGKHYRFSDQLEALDQHHHNHQSSSSSLPSLSPDKLHQVPPLLSIMASINNPPNITTHDQSTDKPSNYPLQNQNTNVVATDFISTSSSSFSGEESEGTRNRKRKLEAFFENLMKEVMDKQENLQKKFLEVMEKREHERMVREEAWKMQELVRMNRESEILAQERAIAAARDTAVISFLNKIATDQQPANLASTIQLRENNKTLEINNPQFDINGTNIDQSCILPMSVTVSTSRWPKAEVEALIRLRTGLDRNYAESNPKGPLWEEISAAMKKLGYNRSSKKCKEKWENINKYFKKVKESNKRRPEDSKTCPYFDQLEALYKEKMIISSSSLVVNNNVSSTNTTYGSENIEMHIMKQPVQQQQPVLEDLIRRDSNNGDGNHEEDDEDDDDDGDEDEDEASGYEIAVNNSSSMANIIE